MHRLFGAFSRRHQAQQGPPRDRCPYKEKPRIGLYGTHNDAHMKCTRVEVSAEVTTPHSTTIITCLYIAEYEKGDVWFPLSEFGKVKEFRCRVNGKEVRGQMARRGKNDQTLFPSDNPEYDARKVAARKQTLTSSIGGDDSDSDDGDKDSERSINQPAPIYYFIIRNVQEQMEIQKGKVTKLEFEICAGNVTDQEGRLNYLFPYTTAPKSPAAFSMKMKMEKTIRTVSTPNRSSPVFPFIRGRTADVVVEISPEKGMMVTDYLFIVAVELGDPIVPQCADPVSLLILVTAVGALVFFSMTNGLEEDY